MAKMILMTKVMALMAESMLSKKVGGQDILKNVFERNCFVLSKALPLSYCDLQKHSQKLKIFALEAEALSSIFDVEHF